MYSAMTTFVVATNSVHTSAALCDYLIDRVDAEDTVHAINSHIDEKSATAEALRDGEDALNAIYSRLGSETTVETHQFLRGNVPAEDVLSFTETVDADEIVLGVRKPTPTSKVAIGSVTEQVLLHSSRPMAVIPRELE
jgi:nucleotide-binding universal stress UspA family protein